MFFGAVRKELFYSAEGWRAVVVAYRQDATNSKLKQVHMEVECGVLGSGDYELEKGCSQELLGARTMCCLSDVIPVEEGTGMATVGMSLKMLQSVGCPTWPELATRLSEQKARVAEESAYNTLHGLGAAAGNAAEFEQNVAQQLLAAISFRITQY